MNNNMNFEQKTLALLKYILTCHKFPTAVGVTLVAPVSYIAFDELRQEVGNFQFTEQDILDISWDYQYLRLQVVPPFPKTQVNSINFGFGSRTQALVANLIMFATDFDQKLLQADITSLQEEIDSHAENTELPPQITEIILVRAKESAIGRLVINKDYAGALHIEYTKKHWALLLKLAKQGHLFTGSKEDATLISYLNTDTSCALYSNKTGFSPQPIIQREGNKYVLAVPLKMMTLTQFNKKINKEK